MYPTSCCCLSGRVTNIVRIHGIEYSAIGMYNNNLWQSVRGDSEHFYVLDTTENGSISERTVNRALIVHTTL